MLLVAQSQQLPPTTEGGRSVLEKYFPEVSEIARGRRPSVVCETEENYFSVWNKQKPWNTIFLKLLLYKAKVFNNNKTEYTNSTISQQIRHTKFDTVWN